MALVSGSSHLILCISLSLHGYCKLFRTVSLTPGLKILWKHFFVIAFFEIIRFISLATFFVLPCVKYENIVFIAFSSYIFLSSTIVVVQILLPKRQFSFFLSYEYWIFKIHHHWCQVWWHILVIFSSESSRRTRNLRQDWVRKWGFVKATNKSKQQTDRQSLCGQRM